MSLREALTMVLTRREDEPAIAAAEALERSIGLQMSVLEFFAAQDATSDWIVTADEIGWGDAELVTRPPPKVVSESAKLRRRLERFTRPVSIKRVRIGDSTAVETAGIEARRASFAIMMRPAGRSNESFRRAIFENTLYESGRPVLLLPPQRGSKSIGSNILVAWDGSREASRALADAEPFLERAETVSVITIETGPLGGLPGNDLAAYLRRNGMRCQQRSIPGHRSDVDSLLIAECEAVDADMMVMGGYGHARLSELLFGGVTRSLVRSTPLPLFLSR